MFCAKCGASNADGAAFCESCGQDMNAAAPQPGQQAYQVPQYQAPYQQAPGGQVPYINNNMGWAIAAILMFWPIGIPAIMASNRVNEQVMRGDYAGAQMSSANARKYGRIAMWITITWVSLWILIMIIIAIAAAAS
jgi:hypothetical protein